MIKKDDKEKNSSEAVIVGMLVGALFMWVVMGSTKTSYSPSHAKNGVDTIFADDSVYAIRMIIDTVYEADIDRTPPDR